MEKSPNGTTPGSSFVYCMPKLPTNSGDLETCKELSVGEDYLIDGRVSEAKIGCGWNASGLDVDMSLAAINRELKCSDVVWWDKAYSHYVSCTLLNDDRDGKPIEGQDVNEQILVKFNEIPSSVHYLIVVVTVYSKQKSLEDVTGLNVKLSYDNDGGKSRDLFKFSTKNFEETAAAVMGYFMRIGSWWSFKATGEKAFGRTVKEVMYNMPLEDIIKKPQTDAAKMKVYVKVDEGKDLAAADKPLFGPKTSDCFVEIKFIDARSVSEVILKDLNPKWSMKYFQLGTSSEADYSIVEFNVWDHDTNTPDDFLGTALVAIGGVCQLGVGKHEMTLDLGPSANPDNKPKKGVEISGSIKVTFEVIEH